MSLKIIKAGILDTIQDEGRNGFQHLGINPSGAMDRFSAALANALLGKGAEIPVLEMHFPAAEILFDSATIGCLTGADFGASIHGQWVPLAQPFFVDAGSVLIFRKWNNGARCYLSVLDEMDCEAWLHSYSTNLKASAGGFLGRPLKKGDVIASRKKIQVAHGSHPAFLPLPWMAERVAAGHEVACIRGEEWNYLTEEARAVFTLERFTVSHNADRMGYQLEGEELGIGQFSQLVSSGVSFGTVQLLPSGKLIVLMADHQTTGGYPRIAHVISADLPLVAQLRPHDSLGFYFVPLEEAEKKWAVQQKYLRLLEEASQFKIENFMHAAVRS